MKRAFVSTLSVLLLIIAGLVLAVQNTAAQNPAGDTGKTAEQVFKNIQVLKGTPADQLQPAMQFISNSLGVECEFCHVQGAFDKDDKKPKLAARKMIEMQAAINKTHFEGAREVTCFSCHHGAEHPAGIPIISDDEPKRPEAPRTDAAAAPALPTADEILNKYIEAAGGTDALHKITSRAMKGTVSFGGRQFPVEVLAKAPNKRISTVHMPNGDNITAFNGHAGWLGNPGGRPPRDMNAQENDAVTFDATFYLPLEIKKMFNQIFVRPAPDKIGGHEVYMLVGSQPGKPPVRLFFDKQSGLLVRSVRYAETPLGRNPTQVDYADYHTDNGVKVPFQWTVGRPLGRFTIQITDMQLNTAIDDQKFEKPAAAAPAPTPAQKPPA